MYCHMKKLHRLFTYDRKWQQVETEKMEYPSWFDNHTRGCPHPDGVILAGSSKNGYEKKMVFLDMYHKNVVELQDLKHNLKNVGMVYDDDTGKLTIAGGENPDGTLSSLVLQLPHLNEDAVWDELNVLKNAVASPMLVNDKEYLYVLGGANCRNCVRMCKEPKDEDDEEDEKQWKDLDDLPEATKANEYSGGLYSGALVDQGKVTVFTKTNFLTLEDHPNDDAKKTWIPKPYIDDPAIKSKRSKRNITHLTPILHGEKIAAGIQRKFAPRITVEILQTDTEGNKYWEKFKSAPKSSRLGAGKFISVNMRVHNYSTYKY